MIHGQDLSLPFELPVQVALNAYNSFKLEIDLWLPFEDLKVQKRKPFFKAGVSKYRRQRGAAARVRQRLPRVKLEIPNESPDNRNVRRKANVVVQVDCRHTSALQCVRYIENKRIAFAMWSGSNQWSCC